MEFYGNEDSRRFQSTLPQGERRGHRPFCDHFGDFNPRSHKGSDLSRRPWVDDRDISIHAPTRGATGVDVSMFSLMDTFQSTLPQGERQYACFQVFCIPTISIHAPTRGATRSDVYTGQDHYFNPRSHKGSDFKGNWLVCPLIISIHAPTRGATMRESSQVGVMWISIHAPTRGATMLQKRHIYNIIFQSTLPQGERQEQQMTIFDFMEISIHAPTRGATIDLNNGACLCDISIHAPTRGATSGTLAGAFLKKISIHAPTRGATAILHKIPYLFYFIFTNPFPISYFHTQPASDF